MLLFLVDENFEPDKNPVSEDEATVRFIINDVTGQIIEESWHNDENLIHSFHGNPGYKEFSESTGNLRLSRWMYQGQLHRWPENEPAEILWAEDGKHFQQQSFYRFGKLHRDHNRPARIWTCPNTNIITREEFWVNGKLHREGQLPAIIDYDNIRGDTILNREFFVDGKKVIGTSLQLKR